MPRSLSVVFSPCFCTLKPWIISSITMHGFLCFLSSWMAQEASKKATLFRVDLRECMAGHMLHIVLLKPLLAHMPPLGILAPPASPSNQKASAGNCMYPVGKVRAAGAFQRDESRLDAGGCGTSQQTQGGGLWQRLRPETSLPLQSTRGPLDVQVYARAHRLRPLWDSSRVLELGHGGRGSISAQDNAQ